MTFEQLRKAGRLAIEYNELQRLLAILNAPDASASMTVSGDLACETMSLTVPMARDILHGMLRGLTAELNCLGVGVPLDVEEGAPV